MAKKNTKNHTTKISKSLLFVLFIIIIVTGIFINIKSTPPPTNLSNNYSVSRLSSGGIGGGGDGINILVHDSKLIDLQTNKSKVLTTKESETLKKLVSAVNFKKLNNNRYETCASDDFISKIVLVNKGTTQTLAYGGSCNDAPSTFTNLDGYLLELYRSK